MNLNPIRSLRMAGAALVIALGGAAAMPVFAAPLPLQANTGVTARLINPSTAEVSLPSGQTLTVDFYGDNIFRLFCDPKGGIVRNPEANPPPTFSCPAPATPSRPRGHWQRWQRSHSVIARGERAHLPEGLISVRDKEGNMIVEQTEPLTFTDESTTLGFQRGPRRMVLWRWCAKRTLQPSRTRN